jgi:hypothetical protein
MGFRNCQFKTKLKISQSQNDLMEGRKKERERERRHTIVYRA